MSEEKTYVFGDPSNSNPMAMLAAMNNGGFGGSNWIWLVFLFALFGGYGNGFRNNVGDGRGMDLLMQGFNGNSTAISQLASTLNCDFNAVQTAINSVQSSINNVGASVGLSGQQVINAIQSGNQTLSSQFAQCCCDNKLLVTTQGYENRIANAEQTAILGGKIDNQTTVINDKFCALEMRDMQDKIDSLREKNTALMNQLSNEHQTAQIQGYVNSVIAPIATDVAAIKAAQPNTVTVPYPQLTAVPTYLANNYYGTGSIWS